jgi:long-subunit acyl-CoA synthetase (AMP-forming)
MERVSHVIYFPAVAKPASVKVPQDKKTIQFIPLSQLEEQGKNAKLGLLIMMITFVSFSIYLDEATLSKRPSKTDIAVIMYTSGSTGTPKGKVIIIQSSS